MRIKILLIIIILIFLVGCQPVIQPSPPINTTNITNITEVRKPLTGYDLFRVRPDNLTIYFLDVNSVLITTPSNKTIIVDSGVDGRPVYSLLKNFFGVSKTDFLVLSHNVQDFVGGSPFLIIKTRPGMILDNGLVSQELPGFFVDYKAAFEGYNQSSIGYDNSIFLDDGVRIDFLVAYDDGQGFSNKPSDNSVIIRVSYGLTSVLLMGGCGSDCEDRILNDLSKADVVLVSTSCDSTSLVFLKKVLPEQVISRSDCDEVRARIDTIDIPTFSRISNGNVVFVSDGVDYVIIPERGGTT